MSKTLGPNAAASSSTRDRSKSFGSKLALDLKKVKSRESAMSDQAMAHQNNMPFSPPLPTAGTGASGSTAKRIRAVPPSAAFDPPTPPLSAQNALPPPVTAGTVGTTGTTASRRPKLRLRYSSSESDLDSEDTDTDSEEEVPWWTFTNRGMTKMRQRVAGEKAQVNGKANTIAGAAAELQAAETKRAKAGPSTEAMSGVESDGKGKDPHSYSQYKHRMRDRFHRKTSRDDASPTPRRADRPVSTVSSTGAGIPILGAPITGSPHEHNQDVSDMENLPPIPPISPDAARKRSKPSPIRSLSHFTSDHIFRRGADRSDSRSHEHSDADQPRIQPRFPARRPFTRSNSAPGSQIDVEELVESPGQVGTPISEHGALTGSLPQEVSSHSLPAIAPQRQLSVESGVQSAPSPGKPGRLHAGHVSDTEAHVPKRGRIRSRLGQMHSTAASSDAEGDEGAGSGSGTNTPRAGGLPIKMRRMNTAQLKLRLPEPISQTFAHGWPHAGSWQDALREEKGRADLDNGGVGHVKVREKGKRKGSYHVRVEDRRRSAPERENDITGAETAGPRTTDTDAPANTPKTPKRVGRRKTRRMRRYREALVPPTPNGLGFEPRGLADDRANGQAVEAWKEGRPGAGEFSWSTPTAVPEGDELSRIETRATTSLEKQNQHAGEKPSARTTSRNNKKRMTRTTTATRFRDPWKTRLKRTMFLDARVTIYIRLLTIMVVTVALALAITIRQSLINIHLPGLIGPSTVLIIAFSCLTLLHGMMAIYREYFGKPIGLWGLRSKMLWVCLDIAFVALWSSVLSLSINDYISTPLECDRGYPWWTAGLSGGYARLLADLGIDPNNPGTSITGTSTGGAITGVDLIKATLGIVLPDQVIESARARNICYRQRGEIGLTLMSMLLYGGNMVLSLFRIFETVRRHAQQERPPMIV